MCISSDAAKNCRKLEKANNPLLPNYQRLSPKQINLIAVCKKMVMLVTSYKKKYL